jgi:hypothetical protein
MIDEAAAGQNAGAGFHGAGQAVQARNLHGFIRR